MLRITVEDINDETKEVNTVLSEETEGLYTGVGIIGIKPESMQVFLHRVNTMELASAIAGSKEMMRCAQLATMLSMVCGHADEDKANAQ